MEASKGMIFVEESRIAVPWAQGEGESDAPDGGWETALPAAALYTLTLDQMMGRAPRIIHAPSLRVCSAKALAKGKARRIRLVHVSDTHLKHPEIVVPPCDVLVHSGDFSTRLTPDELPQVLASFNEWLAAAPAAHRVVVCGNHEIALSRMTADDIQALMPDVVYLQDSGAKIEGIKFYGLPWTHASRSYAFGTNEAGLAKACKKIPKKTDVLVCGKSHAGKRHWGSHALAARVAKIKPKLHLYGHVHDVVGVRLAPSGCTMFSNASYDIAHPVVVVDLYV
ncbi:Ser/Thr protein phosphatase [Thecamonas trahens ATCC 50062]|uniref:Ser/Thr protein phosphatase n=1 Tax=Thecamonas trahens ATCC 50062 TaxID=461836 RepID=A0A0L0DD36_THETB|nr:Ser/Thr protein phosphatase [Thecamonas trahens ATCC 50062]KNC50021.1 Ser/Thr protein phosphatase [Thecamonas trahens ATCC 50062]|eukprot:XP_013757188.1 Ser/Thr protein phosphatase [Thecamonas trahens ATCC 50062]